MIRTCVGCRQRADMSDLVRVVAVQAPNGLSLEVDERRTRTGRGAHVHPSSGCLAKAIARRAFVRALRTAGPVSVEKLEQWWTEQGIE